MWVLSCVSCFSCVFEQWAASASRWPSYQQLSSNNKSHLRKGEGWRGKEDNQNKPTFCLLHSLKGCYLPQLLSEFHPRKTCRCWKYHRGHKKSATCPPAAPTVGPYLVTSVTLFQWPLQTWHNRSDFNCARKIFCGNMRVLWLLSLCCAFGSTQALVSCSPDPCRNGAACIRKSLGNAYCR